MIKVIAFDWYGVGTKEPWRVTFSKDLGEKINIPPQVAMTSFRKFVPEYELGIIDFKEFIRLLLLDLGLPEDPHHFYYLLEVQPEIDFQLMAFIKSLKQKYKTILFSNNYKEVIKLISSQMGNLQQYFDISIFSCEVGKRKPDKEIFQLLISQAEVEPSEILFIDDQGINLTAAEQMGIQTLLYTGYAKAIDDLTALGIRSA